MELFWFTEKELLSRAKQEFELTRDTVDTKRELFKERRELISNLNKSDDKININIAWSQIMTLIALSYQDELTVQYKWWWFEDEEVAENKQILAKNNYRKMWLHVQNYQRQFDRLFYWLSIRTLDTFDDTLDIPVSTLISPLNWYWDINPKWFRGRDFRFHWVERKFSYEEVMNNDNFIWAWKIDLSQSDESKDVDRAMQEPRLLVNQLDETPNKIINIYYHYTNIDWIWYLIVTDEWFTKVLQMDRYIKANWESICPVIINYYSPIEWDIYWESVIDKVWDKQKASSKLFNLQLFKAIREAMWWDFVYNKDSIWNKGIFNKATIKTRYIPATLKAGQRLEDVVREVPTSRLSIDVQNMRELVNREVTTSTWIDSVIQWVRWDKSITKWESQTIQQNANLNLALWNTVDSWGESDFWHFHDYMYERYFDEWKEKVERMQVWIGSKTVTLSKVDFITNAYIDIVIINKSQENAKNEAEKQNLPFYLQLIQDPTLSRYKKLLLQRKVARISWMPYDEIMMYFSDPIEQKAKEDLQLLNANEPIDMDLIDMDEDQEVYLLIYRRWRETQALKKMRLARERVYKKQQMSRIQPQQENPVANQMNNQLVSNTLSKDRQWQAPSIQDIAG